MKLGTPDYDYHTHVVITHPLGVARGDGWDGTFPIVLHTGSRVWVHGCYSHELAPEVLRVGDGTCDAFGPDGECILSVPAAWCRYCTTEEAEGIERARDADERLMGYAQ